MASGGFQKFFLKNEAFRVKKRGSLNKFWSVNMNQTIDQLYCEYRESLKLLMGKYQKTSGPFDDNMDLEEFILRAENLKTLVSLYANLSRETQSESPPPD